MKEIEELRDLLDQLEIEITAQYPDIDMQILIYAQLLANFRNLKHHIL